MTKREGKEEYGQCEHFDFAHLPITICHCERLTIQYTNRSSLVSFDGANTKLLGNSIPEILPDGLPEDISAKENINPLLFDITNQCVRDDASMIVSIVSYLNLTEIQQ